VAFRVILALDINVMTYLLTYLHSSSGTGRSSHFGNNESSQAINGKLITAMIPKTDNVNKTTEMQHAREHVIAL